MAGEARTEAPLESLAIYFKGLANAKCLRLLAYLTQPHYLEEIASELGVARQTAQEHVQQLVELGLLETVRIRTESAQVTSYVIVPARLFTLYEMFGRLGNLSRDLEEQVLARPATTMDASVDESAVREEDLPRLTIVHGMRVGTTSVLAGNGPWPLGRDPTAAVCLDYDPYVSTRHAEIRRAKPGGFELVDLYSSNGTILDWKRVERGAVVRVENGSLVGVGKTLILFRKAA
jgi:DNA-binding transcriptional ArsR family regulator